MNKWKDYATNKPKEREKFIIICDDGVSSQMYIKCEGGAYHCEDGDFTPDTDNIFKGALWMPLPHDYSFAMMDE